MERVTLFADVILPVAVPNLYTYRVPYDLNDKVCAGQRVIVQFGKNKLYSAVIRHIHQTAPKAYTAKYIDSILDEVPVVNEKQFRLWEWLAAYYLCTTGEVMNAALPSGLKLASETKVLLRESVRSAEDVEWKKALSDEEFLVVEALENREVLTIADILQITEKRNAHALVRSLLEKGIVVIQEEIKEKFKPRVESFIRLTAFAQDERNMQELMTGLEKKAFRQLELLMAFLRMSPDHGKTPIKKSDLLKLSGSTDAVLNGLVKKNVLEVEHRETGRLESYGEGSEVKGLSGHQQEAMETIKNEFKEKDVVLLHGVTSSGKTEVYVKLIEETIARGKQVLYLLPEIALTTQIISRLRKYFGDKVGVYHSRLNENERVEVWNKVNSPPKAGPPLVEKFKSQKHAVSEDEPSKGVSGYEIILGARSSLFLPFSDLGLVIVDEEHDTSYKQFDPAPRYHARDSAIYLASIHKAKTLLGSATPSVESFYNSRDKKFGFAELNERFGGVQMPEILVADVKEAQKRKEMRSHFSNLLLDHITLALKQKEQVILFQNRRGFAPMFMCETCGWAPQCTNCDVTLTYHKTGNQLRCHYCGYSISPPTACAACGNDRLKLIGFGTEKIEEDLAVFFPDAKIARMDLDTTRTKFAYQHLINDFEERKIDVLVGTQMVTKGLDFDHVSVVGILNADSMLNYPDFRAFERSYQLMAQVSGRAGRKSKRGKVIIQTHNPNHAVIQHVLNHDFEKMYNEQLLERRNFHYPPFYRLIEVTLLHKDVDQLNFSADFLAGELKKHLGERVIGPGFPLVSRIRNLYHKNILVKVEKESSVSKVKEILSASFSLLRNHAEHKSVRIQADVDPM